MKCGFVKYIQLHIRFPTKIIIEHLKVEPSDLYFTIYHYCTGTNILYALKMIILTKFYYKPIQLLLRVWLFFIQHNLLKINMHSILIPILC